MVEIKNFCIAFVTIVICVAFVIIYTTGYDNGNTEGLKSGYSLGSSDQKQIDDGKIQYVEQIIDGDFIGSINGEHSPTVVSSGVVTQSPTPSPKIYVACSDYHTVDEMYKTPNGNFVTVNNITFEVDDGTYKNTTLKSNVKIQMVGLHGGYYYLSTHIVDIKHIKPVSESESGMRDSCEVI
jgi:hypothetical protein